MFGGEKAACKQEMFEMFYRLQIAIQNSLQTSNLVGTSDFTLQSLNHSLGRGVLNF